MNTRTAVNGKITYMHLDLKYDQVSDILEDVGFYKKTIEQVVY